jgi:hypothetical protein
MAKTTARQAEKSAKKQSFRGSREFFNSSFTDKIGIAHRYFVSLRTVDNWMRARRIPHLKLGRSVRFDITKCDAALARFEIKAIR